MTFQGLKETVPWGRPFDEYVSMFDLSPSDLEVRLLDCGAGPSSFAAEASARDCQVVACDPLYRFNANDIALRIDEIYPLMVANMEAARNRFVWTWAGSPSQHAEQRMTAMRQFLADFNLGHREGRYVAGALPRLPFANDSFDLALSSHFLFLYSAQFSLDFHVAAIEEMLRVARQVRIFPLLDLNGEQSSHLPPIVAEFERRGHKLRVTPVPYEFQRGGNQVLEIDR